MKDLFMLLGFVTSVMVIAVASVFAIETAKCGKYSDVTGRETKMNFGCYVKDSGVWYSMEEFKFKQAGHIKEDVK